MAQIFLIHGTDASNMAYAIARAADLASIIGDRGQSVGIKPNLVLASPADQGATTHPQIVEGVIRYLKDNGFHNLCLLEGSWVGARTEDAYRVCGMQQVCRQTGVPFYDLQKDEARSVDLGGMAISVCRKALDLDFLINLPVVKGHCQTNLTCALKNLKGLIPNREKRRFHTMGLHRPIAHLALAFPRQFVLADNICGDLDFEEGGNPVVMDRLVGCADPVLTDAFACQVMGLSLDQVPYISLAEKLGAGSTDLAGAQVVSLNEGCLFRREAHPTRRVQALARHAEARQACSACYGSLIHALNRLDEQDALGGHREKISIGQGWRGVSGPIGVGSCTASCERSLAGCPPKAAEMVAFLEEQWR